MRFFRDGFIRLLIRTISTSIFKSSSIFCFMATSVRRSGFLNSTTISTSLVSLFCPRAKLPNKPILSTPNFFQIRIYDRIDILLLFPSPCNRVSYNLSTPIIIRSIVCYNNSSTNTIFYCITTNTLQHTRLSQQALLEFLRPAA